jgi:hypothetical protein
VSVWERKEAEEVLWVCLPMIEIDRITAPSRASSHAARPLSVSVLERRRVAHPCGVCKGGLLGYRRCIYARPLTLTPNDHTPEAPSLLGRGHRKMTN